MLQEYSNDFTKNVKIVSEFNIDDSKIFELQNLIQQEINSTSGLFKSRKIKRLKSTLHEVEELQPYDITENGFLVTYERYKDGTLVKHTADLSLCYNLELSKCKDVDTDAIFFSIPCEGYQTFIMDEDGDEIFSIDDGTYKIRIWDVYPGLFEELKKYISTNEVKTLSSLTEL